MYCVIPTGINGPAKMERLIEKLFEYQIICAFTNDPGHTGFSQKLAEMLANKPPEDPVTKKEEIPCEPKPPAGFGSPNAAPIAESKPKEKIQVDPLATSSPRARASGGTTKPPGEIEARPAAIQRIQQERLSREEEEACLALCEMDTTGGTVNNRKLSETKQDRVQDYVKEQNVLLNMGPAGPSGPSSPGCPAATNSPSVPGAPGSPAGPLRPGGTATFSTTSGSDCQTSANVTIESERSESVPSPLSDQTFQTENTDTTANSTMPILHDEIMEKPKDRLPVSCSVDIPSGQDGSQDSILPDYGKIVQKVSPMPVEPASIQPPLTENDISTVVQMVSKTLFSLKREVVSPNLAILPRFETHKDAREFENELRGKCKEKCIPYPPDFRDPLVVRALGLDAPQVPNSTQALDSRPAQLPLEKSPAVNPKNRKEVNQQSPMHPCGLTAEQVKIVRRRLAENRVPYEHHPLPPTPLWISEQQRFMTAQELMIYHVENAIKRHNYVIDLALKQHHPQSLQRPAEFPNAVPSNDLAHAKMKQVHERTQNNAAHQDPIQSQNPYLPPGAPFVHGRYMAPHGMPAFHDSRHQRMLMKQIRRRQDPAHVKKLPEIIVIDDDEESDVSREDEMMKEKKSDLIQMNTGKEEPNAKKVRLEEEKSGEEQSVTDKDMDNKRPKMTTECLICYEEFNSQTRVPRILKECGHTVCEACAEKLMKQNSNEKVVCPFDKRITVVNDVNDLPKNYAFLQILDEKEVPKPKLVPKLTPRNLHCSFHPSEEARFLCTSPDCKIETKLMCAECMVDNGKHEGHSYTSSKKIQERKLKIEGVLKKITVAKISQSQNLNTWDWLGKMLGYHYRNKKQKVLDLYAIEVEKFKKIEIEELRKLQDIQDESRIPYIMNLGRLNCEKSKIEQAHTYIWSALKSGLIRNEAIEQVERQLEVLSIDLKIEKEEKKSFEYSKCSEHPNEKAMFYCKELECSKPEKLMCQECMANEGFHEEHAYTLAKKVTSNQEKLTNFLLQIEDQRDEINQRFEQLEKEHLKSLKSLSVKTKEIKNKTFQEVLFIEHKKGDAVAHFRKFCDVEHLDYLNQKKKVLETRIQNLNDYQIAIKKMLEGGAVDEEVLNVVEISVQDMKEDGKWF